MRHCLDLLRNGIGMRIVFQQHADRLAHSVECVAHDRHQVLLQSVEGDDRQTWPPSPPLQQLSLERRPHGPVALAVGMAGSSHWSLSAAADLTSLRCEFDVACRCTHAPGPLGSTYRVRHAGQLEHAAIVIASPLGTVRLRAASDAFIEAGPNIDPEQLLRIVPAEVHPSGSIAWTVRWRYELEWSE